MSAILGLAFAKHRKNAGIDPRLLPYQLLKAFQLLLGQELATKHPSTFQEFQKGHFAVRITPKTKQNIVKLSNIAKHFLQL